MVHFHWIKFATTSKEVVIAIATDNLYENAILVCCVFRQKTVCSYLNWLSYTAKVFLVYLEKKKKGKEKKS